MKAFKLLNVLNLMGCMIFAQTSAFAQNVLDNSISIQATREDSAERRIFVYRSLNAPQLSSDELRDVESRLTERGFSVPWRNDYFIVPDSEMYANCLRIPRKLGTRSTASWAAIPREGGRLI